MADSGFPVEPCLLTQVLNTTSTAEEHYNAAHKSARNVVERCFGVLKSRFRSLLQHRTLHFSPKVANKIIYSAIILHNICIKNNIVFDDDELEDGDDADLAGEVDAVINQANLLAAGRRQRLQYIQNNF